MSEEVTLFQPYSGSAGNDEGYILKQIQKRLVIVEDPVTKPQIVTMNCFEMPGWLTTLFLAQLPHARSVEQRLFISEGLKQHADNTYPIITVLSEPFPFQALLTALSIGQEPTAQNEICRV